MNVKIVNSDLAFMDLDAIASNNGPIDNLAMLGDNTYSLAKKANSEEFDNALKGFRDKPFSIAVVGNTRLPSKNVILIDLPMKRDSGLDGLKRAYRLIIELAARKGYKSLGIPLLGLGYFGYSNASSYNALVEVVEEFIDKNLDMSILITLKASRPIVCNDKMLCCSALTGEECYIGDSVLNDFIPENIIASINLNKIFNTMTTDEMLLPNGLVLCPMHFVDEYMEINKIKKSFLFANGVAKDDCSRFRTGRKQMQKHHIYLIAIVLGFNRTELLQLMSFGGYSFNPNDRLDLFMHDYYMANELCKGMGEFQDRYYDDNEEILENLYQD